MSDRHPKWVRVEPGHVIPAGQPYRVERKPEAYESASEYPGAKKDFTASVTRDYVAGWFVDSSWRPPLALPTEPTWGIVVMKDHRDSYFQDRVKFAQWDERMTYRWDEDHSGGVNRHSVRDFIPLTPEQVARIEAAR